MCSINRKTLDKEQILYIRETDSNFHHRSH